MWMNREQMNELISLLRELNELRSAETRIMLKITQVIRQAVEQ